MPRRNTTERRESKRREKQKIRVTRRIKELRKLILNLCISMIIQMIPLLTAILKMRLAPQCIKMKRYTTTQLIYTGKAMIIMASTQIPLKILLGLLPFVIIPTLSMLMHKYETIKGLTTTIKMRQVGAYMTTPLDSTSKFNPAWKHTRKES